MGWMKRHALGITIFSVLSVVASVTIGYFLNEAKEHKEEEDSARVLLLRKKAS